VAYTADDMLIVARADGAQRRVIANEGVPNPFAFSPDGTRIAFGTSRQLRVTPVAGGPVTTLASGVSTFVWSPDGTKIAYVSDHLWVVSAAGGAPTLVANSGVQPTWSPDSRGIAYADACTVATQTDGRDFSSTCNGNTYIHVVRNGNDRALSYVHAATAVADTPQWSPAGAWLLFRARPGNGSKGGTLHLIHDDGTGHRDLGTGGSAEWKNDGSAFAFTSAPDAEAQGLFYASPSKTDVVTLHTGAVGCVALSPARNEVLYEALQLGGPNANTVVATDLRVAPTDPGAPAKSLPDVTCAGSGKSQWSPDGSAVVIRSKEARQYGVLGVNRPGRWKLPDVDAHYYGGAGYSPH